MRKLSFLIIFSLLSGTAMRCYSTCCVRDGVPQNGICKSWVANYPGEPPTTEYGCFVTAVIGPRVCVDGLDADTCSHVTANPTCDATNVGSPCTIQRSVSWGGLGIPAHTCAGGCMGQYSPPPAGGPNYTNE